MAFRKERVNDIKYNLKMAPSLKTGEINLQTVVFSPYSNPLRDV